MKKTVLAATVAAIALYAILAFSGTASAQSVGGNCDASVGYSGVCPDLVSKTPPDVSPAGSTLPRTGSDSLPLARAAIVLIGVGGALTVMAGRKRLHHAHAPA